MQILTYLLFFVMANDSFSQIYIKEKSDGHNLVFLTLTKDSAHVESYSLRLKVQKRLNRHIVSSKRTPSVSDFPASSIVFEGITFRSDINESQFGDFELLYPNFSKLSTGEKLNVCRNKYLILNPPRELKKIIKERCDVIERFDFRMEHLEFTKKIQNLN